MEQETLEKFLNFIEYSLDCLEIPIISKVYKVIKSGSEVLRSEEEIKFNEFKKNIRSDLRELITSKPYYKNNIYLTLNAFKSFYEKNSLILYYGKKAELVELIFNKTGCDKEIVNAVVDIIFKNFSKLITEKEWLEYIARLSIENKDKIDKLPEQIAHQFESMLRKNFSEILRTFENPSPSIKSIYINNDDNDITSVKNYNKYYVEAFNRELFLECQYEYCDRTAKLSDVYIEPQITNHQNNISYNKFIDWCLFDSNTLKKAVLVLGKAGIGKTSLISDIVNKYESPSTLNKRRVHTILLRNCIDKLKDIQRINNYSPYTAWKIIPILLHTSVEKLDNSIVILDGLDELSILIDDFNVSDFVSELTEDIPYDLNIKILMTSREGYFKCKSHQNLSTCELFWDDSCVVRWCDSYKKAQPLKKEWCNSFPEMYREFDNETVKEIISCPIILYMMCFSEIKLSDDISRARIYNQVFGSIGKREHDIQNRAYFRNDVTYDNFKKFIKEISFIVSINDGSYGNSQSLDVNNSIIQSAERKVDATSFVFEENKIKFFAMFYFASESNPNVFALQVAHRSVFEYFAALKIYEDYFKDSNLFLNSDKPIETWRILFKAFRYKCLEYSVFEFLKDIVECENNYSRFRERFFRLFCETFSEEYLLKVINTSLEYNTKEKLYSQFDIAYSNIFSLLEVFEFYDWTKEKVFQGEENILSQNIDYIKYLLKHFSVNSQIYIKPQVLYLENVNFKYGDISGANMSLSIINGADLSNLSIMNASFSNAELREVNIIRIDDSDLSGSDLRGITKIKKHYDKITFRNCNLGGVDLRDNDLEKIQFDNCNLDFIHISSEQKEFILNKAENIIIKYAYIDNNQDPIFLEYNSD